MAFGTARGTRRLSADFRQRLLAEWLLFDLISIRLP